MAEIGTATVKVVPDLSQFESLMRQATDLAGLVLTEREEITYERDEDGGIARSVTVRTTSVEPRA